MRQPVDHRAALVAAFAVGDDALIHAVANAFNADGFSLPLRLHSMVGGNTEKRGDFQEEVRWLRRLHAMHGEPGRAADEFLETLQRNTLTVQRHCAIWGIAPNHPLRLTPTLQLRPLTQFPPSTYDPFPQHALPHDVRPQPQAEFIEDFELTPLYYRPEGPDLKFDVDDKYLFADLAEVACLLASGPAIRVAEWTTLPQSGPFTLFQSSLAVHNADHATRFEVKRRSYDEGNASQLFSKYLAMSKADRSKTLVGLRRLNRSWFENSRVSDRAIDLGIALEALLSSASDPQGEITFRLSMRGARMIGGPPQNRDATASLIRQMYNRRSKAAHGGDIDAAMRAGASSEEQKKAEDNIALLARGRVLVAKIAETILLAGRFPDFQRLDLGPDESPQSVD